MAKCRPASFFTKSLSDLVSTGNLDDDFDVIAQADWVIEAIVENLKIKQDLMARIDAVRSPQCIVSTNTSGIPVASIRHFFSGCRSCGRQNGEIECHRFGLRLGRPL